MAKKVKIVGAGGYGGVGLLELLLRHPEVELSCLVAKDDTGLPISQLYPHLEGFCDLMVHAADAPEAQAPADFVFFATPDGVGMQAAAAALATGAKVVDFSGDFRFNEAAQYADYAGRLGKDTTHASPDLLADAAYGLPELNREAIKQASLVGNPGCFAVACLLGLAPAVEAELVELDGIICDGKTGVSGAGKKLNASFHYPARYEQINAYKLSGHQHVCEVEKQLQILSGNKDIALTFTPHVVPAVRGILCTLYAKLKPGVDCAEALSAYKTFYENETFVRVYERDTALGTNQVRGSNYCNVQVDVDARSGILRVVSHIDNLLKGQAGNAVQNMNVMLGLPEAMGLDHPGNLP